MPACLVARQAATNTSERAARKQTEQLDGAKRASAETAKRICSATCACTSTTVGARDHLERKLSRRLQPAAVAAAARTAHAGLGAELLRRSTAAPMHAV